MFKNILFTTLILSFSFLSAEIIETYQIEEVEKYAEINTLILFDIDDTLIGTSQTLGSAPWRRWLKSKKSEFKYEFNLHDALTLYIAKNVPYKTVEESTASLIKALQKKEGVTVFGFTARERAEWYTTHFNGIDELTFKQLQDAQIDFTISNVPDAMAGLNPYCLYKGIIFSEHETKGEALTNLLKDLNYLPAKLVFIDDNLEQVKSVEKAAQDLGIPFVGVWYRANEKKFLSFNPMIANIQLQKLLINKEIWPDDIAEIVGATRQEDPVQDMQRILLATGAEQKLSKMLKKGKVYPKYTQFNLNGVFDDEKGIQSSINQSKESKLIPIQ